MNLFVGMGRLGHDVSLRYTTDELAVARFSVALARGKDKDGNDKGTDWIECIAFGKTAESIKRFFEKGDLIAFEGQIQASSYEDNKFKNEEGEPCVRKKIEIVIKRWHFTGGKDAEKPAAKTNEPAPAFKSLDDDIPF